MNLYLLLLEKKNTSLYIFDLNNTFLYSCLIEWELDLTTLAVSIGVFIVRSDHGHNSDSHYDVRCDS